MSNVLTAIKSIVSSARLDVNNNAQDGVQNRANQMGDALEEYIKNAFADCLGKDKKQQVLSQSKTFSYLGNSNNPPDAMIKGGDAIEIKKINTFGTSQLQLNSSYPKNKLHSDNPKLSKICRTCEEWNEKDMLYVVGHIEGKTLKNIIFVYGDIYCDKPKVYEKVENTVTKGLSSLQNVELAETKELGRINKVDHLGITDLRIRGMWLIASPFQQFKYLTNNIKNYEFKLVAIIHTEKYHQLENTAEFEIFCMHNNVSIINEKVQDPQNPASLIDVKLITYYY